MQAKDSQDQIQENKQQSNDEKDFFVRPNKHGVMERVYRDGTIITEEDQSLSNTQSE